MKGALKAAALIGALAVLIDFVLHYVVLEPYQMVGGVTIDFLEPLGYFAAKFLVFAVVAYIFLAAKFMDRLGGPIIYGLAASAGFGAVYYFAPGISVGTGSMPLPGKIFWGGIHMGAGTIAAGIYERDVLAIIVGVLILVGSAATLVILGPTLFAAFGDGSPSGGGGY